jgi:hypothetical protein
VNPSKETIERAAIAFHEWGVGTAEKLGDYRNPSWGQLREHQRENYRGVAAHILSAAMEPDVVCTPTMRPGEAYGHIRLADDGTEPVSAQKGCS